LIRFYSSDVDQYGGNPEPSATFAMRHRALRAVSVLCPQEALEQVVKSEGYLSSGSSSGSSCTLQQCTFGAFVAKEIEEMGLPLPNDDLGRLSSMHFLSYARTLWRHHRGNDSKRSKGRLLLLLLEMSLKDVETDLDFVQTLLMELMRLKLPRTNLLALECVNEFVQRNGDRILLEKVSIVSLLDVLALSVSSEIRDSLSTKERIDETDTPIVATVDRIFQVVAGLSLSLCKPDYIHAFIVFGKEILDIVTQDTMISYPIRNIIEEAHRLVSISGS